MNNGATMVEEQAGGDLRTVLSELRDSAILLDMAKEYICEKHFLERIGYNVEEKVVFLANHLEDLKKKFVGKPMQEMDIEQPLVELSQMADFLQNADEEACGSCEKGKLGKEFDQKIRDLVDNIESLRKRVEGRDVSYTAADSVISLFGRLKIITRTFVLTYKILARVIALALIFCLVSLIYLFATMETEKDLLINIDKNRAEILSLQKNMDVTKEKGRLLKQKIDQISKNEMSREEKIEVMDLNIQVHKNTEEQEKIQGDINIEQKKLDRDIKKVDVIRSKSFFQKLFKQ